MEKYFEWQRGAQEGIIWKIGKGDQISFSFDNQVEYRILIDILGIDYANVPYPDVKANDFIIQESQWDIIHLNLVLNNHLIVYKILGIPYPFVKEKSLPVGG